jgi:hypothetical protein
MAIQHSLAGTTSIFMFFVFFSVFLPQKHYLGDGSPQLHESRVPLTSLPGGPGVDFDLHMEVWRQRGRILWQPKPP